MKVLSIQVGHNATVGYASENEIQCVVSQEKFDNIKNSWTFPTDAINFVKTKYGIQNFDHVVIARKHIFSALFLTKGQPDWNKKISFIKRCFYYCKHKLPVFIKRPIIKMKFEKIVIRECGVKKQNISYVLHHDCHAYAPLAFQHVAELKPALIFTLDSRGDKYCATVSILENGVAKRIAHTDIQSSIGTIYAYATVFLGMKMMEHEYKVMGLAAYAKEKYFMPIYNKIFKDLLTVDKNNLCFKSKLKTDFFYKHLAKHALGGRFDNIAGALQFFTEKYVLEWIEAAIKKTGINNIITSGGVFMNVKLNQKIHDLPSVNKVFFMPSCGDESNAIGALKYAYKNIFKTELQPLTDLYLGMDYSDQEIEKFVNSLAKDKYKIEYFADIETKIAELLVEHAIVARFKGKTEFGARSLGNRAILANPSDMKNFYKVNDQIKVRDFWMPFAPSVLDTHAASYFKNYDAKKYQPEHMILTYQVHDVFLQNCRAAMHQGDLTSRPQVVSQERNPDYYKIIKVFSELTGIGAILNTSFNLHGYPLVGTLEQAIFTFANSGLESLAIGNYLVSKIV